VDTFELLVMNPHGKRERTVTWNGRDGVDAARNYVSEHPGATVIAWRKPVSPVSVFGRGRIID